VAGTFRRMLLVSALFGLGGAAIGVFASYQLDTPTGPTMVLADVIILSLCLFGSSVLVTRRRQKLRHGSRPLAEAAPPR